MKPRKTSSHRIIEVDLGNPLDVIETLMMIADRGSLSITCGGNMNWQELSKALEEDGYKRFDSIGELLDYIRSEFTKETADNECQPDGCSCNCKDCQCQNEDPSEDDKPEDKPEDKSEDKDKDDEDEDCKDCPIAALCVYCREHDGLDDDDDDDDDEDDDDEASILLRMMRQNHNNKKEIMEYIKKQRKKTVKKTVKQMKKYLDATLTRREQALISTFNAGMEKLERTQDTSISLLTRKVNALLDLVTPMALNHKNAEDTDKTNKDANTSKGKGHNNTNREVSDPNNGK